MNEELLDALVKTVMREQFAQRIVSNVRTDDLRELVQIIISLLKHDKYKGLIE